MNFAYGLITFVEIAITLLIIWGFYHEDKLIEFEDKMAWIIASYIRKVRKHKYMKKHNKAKSKSAVRYINNEDMEKVVYNTSTDNVA